MKIARGLVVFGAALGLLAAVGAARAQSVEQFYKGRTIHLIIPTSPGGNYDHNARLLARHFGRFVPGNPAVVAQNIPDSGGMLVANRLYIPMDRDGATIAIVERGTPQLPYEGDANAKYDPLKFTWIGSLSSYENDAYLMLVMNRHPAKTLDDLKKPGALVRLGGDKPGSTNLTFAILARDVLKLPVQIVRGYNGGAPMFLAMQSGELDGQVIGMGSARGAQPALWDSGQLRPLLQFARQTRLKEFPDVPTARELVTDPAALSMMEFAEISFFMALPFVAPPDIPADRAAALKKAFMDMVRDPLFLEDARKAGFEITPVDGDGVRALVARMAATPKDVIARYVGIVSRGRE
jgi:tripartite-type tricarboxylate transporter receptor subunit TctC